jgi:hypothetical protein
VVSWLRVELELEVVLVALIVICLGHGFVCCLKMGGEIVMSPLTRAMWIGLKHMMMLSHLVNVRCQIERMSRPSSGAWVKLARVLGSGSVRLLSAR